MCVCVLLGTHHVSCLHVSCLFGGVSLQRCGGFSIVVLPLTPLSTRWLTNIILFRFQVVTPVGRCSTTHNSQPDMVSKRRLQGLEKQIRSKFHPCETNRKSHEHKRKLHSPANMKSESRRLRATHFADGCEHVWPGAKQSMPLDPGIFKSTPRLKVLKRDHRRGILGSILCPFGIRPDWQCVTSYISGAARSVSRDIPFVFCTICSREGRGCSGITATTCNSCLLMPLPLHQEWRHDARYICPPPTTAPTATATRRGRKSFKVQELPQVNSFNTKLPCAVNFQIEHCSKSVGN